jgi:hypothetical protein
LGVIIDYLFYGPIDLARKYFDKESADTKFAGIECGLMAYEQKTEKALSDSRIRII